MSKEGKRVREMREKMLQALGEFRKWMHEHGQGVQDSLNALSQTNTENFQNLCDYIDLVDDKVNGTARALYAYTDLLAGEVEDLDRRVEALESFQRGDDAEPRDEGWMAKLTEPILIGAANNARDERLEQYAERHREELLKEAEEEREEGAPKALHEMSDQELIAATDESLERKLKSDLPPGVQVFGD